MSETTGIEILKKAVKTGLNLGHQIVTAGEDGFQWTDAFGFIDDVQAVAGVVKDGKEIVAELKDLTDEERTELYDYIQNEFDIPDDKIEGVIEDSLAISFSIVSLIGKIKAL